MKSQVPETAATTTEKNYWRVGRGEGVEPPTKPHPSLLVGSWREVVRTQLLITRYPLFMFSSVCVENVQTNKQTNERTRGLISKEIVLLLR